MNHVGVIKAIVAQVVEQNLVRREIVRLLKMADNLVDSQQQRCFAQLVVVSTIAEMADWTDCEYYFQFRILL